MRRLLIASAVILAACGGASAPADAYETYLANNPDQSIVLSREDAQTRALLGCSINPQPGTIDYVLRQAYRVRCAKD